MKTMIKEKKIGIPGWIIGNAVGVTLPYASFFNYFGKVEILLPNDTEVKDLDLLVLPGGPDVEVQRYLQDDEKISFYVGKPCVYREWFDRVMLPKYMAKRTPVFGICRGHQSFAVKNGGTLVQNMWHASNGEDRSELVHTLGIDKTILEEFEFDFGKDDEYSCQNHEVNSIHHQTVDLLPKNAVSLANFNEPHQEATNEAIAYLDYPSFTVQWHPEEIVNCALSNEMIDKLLDKDYVNTQFEKKREIFENNIITI